MYPVFSVIMLSFLLMPPWTNSDFVYNLYLCFVFDCSVCLIGLYTSFVYALIKNKDEKQQMLCNAFIICTVICVIVFTVAFSDILTKNNFIYFF